MTSIVKSWLQNDLKEGGKSKDYGFVLALFNQSTVDYKRFHTDRSANPPSIVINYAEDTSMTNGVYLLKNVKSGKYLDVYNNGTTSGAKCIQYGKNGNFNQQWQVKHLGDG